MTGAAHPSPGHPQMDQNSRLYGRHIRLAQVPHGVFQTALICGHDLIGHRLARLAGKRDQRLPRILATGIAGERYQGSLEKTEKIVR